MTKTQFKEPFIYVGWSFGGLNAQLFASEYPNDLSAIVLIDPMDATLLEQEEFVSAMNVGIWSFFVFKLDLIETF